MYKFFNLLICFLFLFLFFFSFFLWRGVSILVELDLLLRSVLNLNIPFILDLFSVIFRGAVIVISGCVIYYNGFYIDREIYYNRFCKLVLLFVLSIFFLIIIPNLLGLMVGWDGLGLTSYLLVIYYQDKRSLGSGTLTVLRNRIGDVLFFIGIRLVRSLSRWGFIDINISWGIRGLCGLIIVGSITKSAQIPFSAWLPAAIAAPSPVSALVHSSTLVTAGVYVLIRFSARIRGGWYLFLGVISSITIILAAVSAIFEPDVKKVVALSTLSQLGVIILSLSVGAVSVCFFHLIRHALFKALMFLCVGRVIHFSGIQDLRYLGGFIYSRPIIILWLTVACFSLAGFPFLSGFYSKDLVIEAFLGGGFRLVLFLIVIISTCLTAVYRGITVLRLMNFSISRVYNGIIVSSNYVSLPCGVLGLGALFGGGIIQNLVLDLNFNFNIYRSLKIVPIFCVIFGIILLIIISLKIGIYSYFSFGGNLSWEGLSTIMAKIWFIPVLRSDLYSREALELRLKLKRVVEDGYMERSFGGERRWIISHGLSSIYIQSQRDYLGMCLLKGVIIMIRMVVIIRVINF